MPPLQVANESNKESAAAFDISIVSFAVEVISTERVDHTWIALAYGEDLYPEVLPTDLFLPCCLQQCLTSAFGKTRSHDTDLAA